MASSYIKRIEILGFWGKYDIIWDNLHPDVNILMGINGSGKSTVLNILNSLFSGEKESIKKNGVKYIRILFNDYTLIYNDGVITNSAINQHLFTSISTFDVPVTKSKLRTNESPLMLELRQLILDTGSNSFNDYRLRATSPNNNSKEINERIKMFFILVDNLFKNTGKKIEIDSSNKIVFKTEDEYIQLEQLSSGEKQMLIILFKVFLMDNKPFILLMDEPEISLHISWQQDLIATLRKLNPNCQLIITTHSPGIFGKGWGDKVTFMEKLFQK